MTQNSFTKIVGVSVFHTYFENNKCNCLHFIPIRESESVLNKFGFKINNNSNGFELFYNSTSTVSSVLDYIEKTTSIDYFEFTIKSNDANISLYTQMPINWLGQVNFSSQDTKNHSNKNRFVLNQILEPSNYNTHFGSLKIYFQDIQNSQDLSIPIHFDINFSARATQWQYYIINRNAIPLENPSILEKGKTPFDGPEIVTIQTGEQALLFTSNTTLIPLSEKPKYKFDLINTTIASELTPKKTSAKTILKGLPVPDVSRIGIIKVNGQNQVSSPMYIYL
jgi:hypothetical protein